ncbi:MAG: hypothetical protein U9R52_04375, partial [Candidatus Omnitrophota bacterium]|nr:hypothetical protein [Candidatus Omnitrophota bacterium]
MPSSLLCHKGNNELIKELRPDEMRNVIRSEKGLLWLDIVNPGKDELDMLEKVFELHPLTLEDCI